VEKLKIQGITARLPSPDFEESKKFYVETLDCTLVEKFEGLA
jgi:catechol 2,3-dioxygenase-like lactoylglutathione lyase family enzyme